MTTPKESLEFYADPKNWKGGSILDMEASHFDGWTKAQQALASLQDEDAVERVARVISRAMLDNPTGGTSEERAAKRRAIASEYAAAYVADCATGLVPDEAAVRADEREKCETGAIHDIAAERKRQREIEGWTLEHDDGHDRGELAAAAACYAVGRCIVEGSVRISERGLTKNLWPWSLKWWKPKGRRRNLVRAATLIVAEIERIDRAAAIRSGGVR